MGSPRGLQYRLWWLLTGLSHGFPLFFLGLALWLESYAISLALLLPFLLLSARIKAEERTLGETLPGCAADTRRVHHRLVPFVW